MKRQKLSHRLIATFFLLIFLPSLIPTNLFASNNGPKAPEAASFEPVDATDMVNLITGQYSYVLPLLNVPSPEGGYPLALGYHSGISMDEDASWAGLGWNVNPGSIDRSTNGYPDDYSNELINEYFYDSSNTEYVSSISVGYSNGAISVGLGFNWGSNQSLGGVVSVGYGYQDASGFGVGANASVGFGNNAGQASVGVGIVTAGGLTFGITANTNGTVGVSAGAVNSNGEGFSIGYDSAGNITGSVHTGGAKKLGTVASIGISLSTDGEVSASMSTIGGTGQSYAFKNTLSMGDYCSSSSGWMVPLSVPTPIGVFSLSFGKQEVTYFLSKNKTTVMNGLLYFNKIEGFYPVWTRNPNIPNYVNSNITSFFENLNCAMVYRDQMVAKYPELQVTLGNYIDGASLGMYMGVVNTGDVHEFSLDEELDLQKNNLILPNYDNFNVSGQGLSGSFRANFYSNAVINGVSIGDNSLGYRIYYDLPPDPEIGFKKPDFYFENEISTYLNTTDANPVEIYTGSYPMSIAGYYNHGDHITRSKRRTSKAIRYWINGDLVKDPKIKTSGFLETDASGFNRASGPPEGIGAFEITAIDGKTYHYSLPVYNQEIITRRYGMIPGHEQEWEAYMEKRQLQPFATHWLLTAVTGPDFVDNGDGKVGDGDLGYYTSFDYGLWSNAYIWNQANGKEFYTDQQKPTIKTWIKGRKQIYYLDKIRTRTHTAIFVKETRDDSRSREMVYNSVTQEDNREMTPADFQHRFTVPIHMLMKLKKILLFKNEDLTADKTSGTNQNASVEINYSKNYSFANPMSNPGVNAIQDIPRTKKEIATFNNYDNIFDTNDNWASNIARASKVIEFNHDYSLYKGERCLTLKSVDFKGKGGNSVLPPYKFEYVNTSGGISYSDFEKYTDGWGYYTLGAHQWSLREITTPSGGKIAINYEPNKFKSALPPTLIFSAANALIYSSTMPTYNSNYNDLANKKVVVSIGSNNGYPITMNQPVSIKYEHYLYDGKPDPKRRKFTYEGSGYISQILPNGKYEVTFNQNVTAATPTATIYPAYLDITKKMEVTITMNASDLYVGGGTRVKSLVVSDDINNYATEYSYGENENGIGYVSYVPYAQNTYKEMPYSAELPAPRVMYEYVAVRSKNNAGLSNGKIRYKFNILKEKTPGQVKFGNLFEIQEQENTYSNIHASSVSISKFTMKDNLNAIGQLLEVATFNDNNQMLNRISNKYYAPDAIPNNNGVLKESYHTYKVVDPVDASQMNKWVINNSTRIKYPSILSASVEENNGHTYTTKFQDYDDVSGVSKEQIMFSSDGKLLKSRILPAFRKYVGMGGAYFATELKSKNINMLSQIAAYYNYIYQNGQWKETSVGITTWSNLWQYKDIGGDVEPYMTVPNYYEPTGNYSKEDLYKYSKQFIWRKHKTFVWNGPKDANGIFLNYDSATDDGFKWLSGVYGPGIPNFLTDPIYYGTWLGTSDVQPTQWKQTSEVTRYDHFSNVLEIKDINNNKASTKMDHADSKVIATGNAGYNEMFYAGAENIKYNFYLEPEVRIQGGAKRTQESQGIYHTGKYAVETDVNQELGIVLRGNQHRSGKYKLSVWVKKDNVANARVKIDDTWNVEDYYGPFNGETYYAGNWVLKTHYFNCPVNETHVYVTSQNGLVYYDDIMLRPVASSVTGYVYNEWDEVQYIIANNGLATKFEYHQDGSLKKTFVEVVEQNGIAPGTGGFKLRSENTRKYKNLP